MRGTLKSLSILLAEKVARNETYPKIEKYNGLISLGKHFVWRNLTKGLATNFVFFDSLTRQMSNLLGSLHKIGNYIRYGQ